MEDVKQTNRKTSAQMMLLDALVFFLVLSIAAALPPLMASATRTSAGTIDMYDMQEAAEAVLFVFLQSTIPVVEASIHNMTYEVHNIRVDELLLYGVREENNITKDWLRGANTVIYSALLNCLPIGYGAKLEVRSWVGETASYGLDIPPRTQVCSVEQRYEGDNTTITLLLWRM